MKAVKMRAFKVLKKNDKNAQNCIEKDEPLDAEALALFNSRSTYNQFFKTDKRDASQTKQRLSVLRISHGERTIYRQYAGRGISFGENTDGSKCVGLSPNSWQQLCLDDDDNKDVLVTKSWWFPFFWNHSNSATRISFRLGIIGLALTIAGIVVSIVLC